MHDVELAQRAQQGDLDAYETLLRRHQQGTHRAAFFLLRQRQEAEDAVQEAFIRAWDRIDQFDVERDFRPWLLKIVVNEARDRLRESGSRQRLRLRAIQETRNSDSESSPEQSAVAREQMETVLTEINRMDGERSDDPELPLLP
ncbi:MAG: sigma-70 family RNA polymerase sigma factor [Thermomicrobiales bacterium]